MLKTISPLSVNTPSAGSENFINPAALTESFGLREGMKIADFGAGSGYFTLCLAAKVGEKGQITALDILESALEVIRSQAAARSLKNIQTVRKDLEAPGGSGLPDNSQDFVLLANILFQSAQKMDMVKEAKRILVSGGQLAVIDWKETAVGLGPPVKMRIKEEELKKQITDLGLEFKKELAVGQFHFGMMFSKS